MLESVLTRNCALLGRYGVLKTKSATSGEFAGGSMIAAITKSIFFSAKSFNTALTTIGWNWHCAWSREQTSIIISISKPEKLLWLSAKEENGGLSPLVPIINDFE